MFPAFLALSEERIYVSRFTGYDTKTCGKVSSPCRTISYGIQKLSTGLYIYLDGTNTLRDPYSCETLGQGYPGIYLDRSVLFVGIKSRAHISCIHGKAWLADGSKHGYGVRIGFSGLAFQNTSVLIFDAFVAVDDAVFAKTKSVSLYIQVVKLSRLHLSLNNVVFQRNTACITIKSKNSRVYVNMTNTSFDENGDLSSTIPSLLWLTSKHNLINIQLKNCSFKKNMFKKYGMFFDNELGTTNVSVNQLKLEENSQSKSSIDFGDSMFFIRSARVFMRLKYGFILNASSVLFGAAGQSAEINISNIEVDGFYSRILGGGVFNLLQSDSCTLLIKDSFFRNGFSYGSGGVICIFAPKSTLIIENSTCYNTSSSTNGGAVYIHQMPKYYNQSTKCIKNAFALLRIINSSFSYTKSRQKGGAVWVYSEKLSVIIRDSLFLRCNARSFGGALHFFTSDNATISLYNSNFSENTADDGAVIQAGSLSYECRYFLSFTNVTLSENILRSQTKLGSGVVKLAALCMTITVDLKNTHFIKNVGGLGASIFIFSTMSTLQNITLDACIFRKNVGNLGTIFVHGKIKTSLTCRHSIFDSNVFFNKDAFLGINLYLKDSMVRIINTTFVNNFCPIISALLGGVSNLTITNSNFVRNNNIRSTAPLVIYPYLDQPISRITILISKVLFQENTAITGVLYLNSGDAEFENCTFLNNFAFSINGIILASVGGDGRNSTKLVIRHSVFTQTTTKFYNNTKKMMTTSFLRIFGPITITVVNSTFNQTTKSDVPLILAATANMITFDSNSLSFCPLGQDIKKTSYSYLQYTLPLYKVKTRTGIIFSCKECDYNFYSRQRGTARGLKPCDDFQCLPCPRGADCVPVIKSKTNYWGYHASLNPPKLAFTICPFGYCKSPPSNGTEYNACQGKRTGVMCGMCSLGYTEALWSTYCTPVKHCNDHWFWILFLVLVFLMAVILVFNPPFVSYCLKQILWFRQSSRSAGTQAYDDILPSFSLDEETPQENIALSLTEQHKKDKRQFSRFVEIIFYFYQIAQLLLSSVSLKKFFDSHFLEPVLGFFNFQPSFTKQGFLCPFSGLTPETKLVFKVVPVFGTLIAIFFIYALHSIVCRIRGAIRPSIAPFLQASVKTIFLGYATMATVSISLIRCVSVADETRWFYNGNITCWQWWQYASITFIAVFVIPFILVLAVVSFKLHNDKITVRQFLQAIIFPLPFLFSWLLYLPC